MAKKINRRSFIKKIILGIAGIEVGYLVYDTMQNKLVNDNKNSLFSAGKINSFEKNRIYPFTSEKFYLSVSDDGGFLAVSIKCTHLGCMVQAKNNRLECPCHASIFDKHGEVLSPPATRPLDIFPVIIDKGEILVDTQSPVRRKSFDKSQITYA